MIQFYREKLLGLIRGFFSPETLRYLIFGVLTVAVNIASYGALKNLFGILWANTIAFFLAVLFAYWTNCKFVFQVPFTKKSFFEFVGMRIGTILIDNGGMLLMTWLNWNDMFAKVVVNIIIIGLNYLFSKLFIFRK